MSNKKFGSGWISGSLAIFLGALALGGVLGFMHPSLFTSPELRAHYPIGVIRFLIGTFIYLSFGFGGLCVLLRKWKLLGFLGLTFALAAHLLGGARVEMGQTVNLPFYFALDSFLLSLLYLSIVFVPLERLRPLHPSQPVLRKGWQTDLKHFFVNHFFIQAILYLAFLPATIFFAWTARIGLHQAVSSQPMWLQFIEAFILSDMVTYWTHRAFHSRLLWPFHAIHHSSRTMDWLAGSRMHWVDIVLTRALGFIPLYAFGFSLPVIYAYVLFISVHAVFIHANLRVNFGPLRWIIAAPEFHHWHHSDSQEVFNKNFSVHGPLLDLIFGTLHFPKHKWPKTYGIPDQTIPDGYFAEQLYPFGKMIKKQ